MTANVSSLNAYSYQHLFTGSSSSGKLIVPVQPTQVVYSQFDHVSGVAAKNNQDGVSVNKIQILNTLIEQLVAMKQKPDMAKSDTMVNESQIDVLINTYQDKINQAVTQAQTNPFIFAGAAPQAGQLFSIEV